MCLSGLIFFSSLIAGEKQNYHVQKNILGNAQKAGEYNTVTFTVYENNLEKYVIQKELAYDLPLPHLRVFSAGQAVLVDAFTARLTFYDAFGSQVLQTDLIKEAGVDYERAVYSSLSGESVALALFRPKAGYIQVFLYKSDGQFLNNFRIDGRHINALSYSDDAQMLAVSVLDWKNDHLNQSTMFFDTGEKLLAEIKAGFTNGQFDTDQDIFIGYSNRNSFIYHPLRGDLNFLKTAADNKMILTASFMDKQIAVISADKPFLKDGKWLYESLSVDFYNINGVRSSEKRIDILPFTEYELSKSGTGLLFKTENGAVPLR